MKHICYYFMFFYRELNLFTTWPVLSDSVVVDSEGFSDLEPQTAPEWSVQVKMASSPACLLGEYMTDFIHLCNNQKNMVELLGENASYTHDDDQTLSTVFNVLTESRIPTISTVMGRTSAKKNKRVEGPLTEDILLPILYFLFPDAEDNSVRLYLLKFLYYNVNESSLYKRNQAVSCYKLRIYLESFLKICKYNYMVI